MKVVKKRVFSGVQPTGIIHLGNYVGALSMWVENQDLHENIFCIVDMHAITIPESVDPKVLRKKIREVAALYIACGIDPEKSSIFIQSHVREHAELTWVLNCATPVGWLERMTQYKVKSKNAESVGMGLLDYPVLMAADILLYDTNLVPVGDDQIQHVELTRDIAARFNNLFGEVFVIPEYQIRKSGARIMGLDDPLSKMSKSVGELKEGHAIGLLDSPDVIKKSIMRSVTDSINEVRFEFATPGVINLLTIYEVLTGKTRPQIEEHFQGKGYGFLKKDIAETVIEKLAPIRKKYEEITKEPEYIDKILQTGAKDVGQIATKTFERVKNAIGMG